MSVCVGLRGVSEMRGTGGDICSRGAATKEYEGTLGLSPYLTPTSRRYHRSAIAGRLFRIISVAVAEAADSQYQIADKYVRVGLSDCSRDSK